jgi:membrane-anchored mycosin MYCP
MPLARRTSWGTRARQVARARRLGVPGRAATVLLAATIGMLGSAFSPLNALAQQTGPAAGADSWEPPPLPSSPDVPGDNGGNPVEQYQPSKSCVQRELGQNTLLQTRPWGQGHLQIEELHKLMLSAKGSIGGGIKVAVIDTGVTEHPYLKGRVESGGDYVSQADRGLLDCDGHGTEVAGIIAADTPSNIGFKGVAPNARIVSIRQSSQNFKPADKTSAPPAPPSTGQPGQPPTSSPGGQPPSSSQQPSGSQLPPSTGGNGTTSGQSASDGTGPQQGKGGRQQGEEGTAGTVDTLAMAVVRAANTPGVGVINMSVDNCRKSLGGLITPGERKLQAAIRYAVDRNVVVVAAAGNTTDSCQQNTGPDPNQPNSIVTPPWFSDDVLSVGAIQRDGGIAPFSVNGPWVSVAAPGTEIISLDPAKGSDLLANQSIEDGQAQAIQGTSFAAPYVTGVVALVRAMYPRLSARQVMNRIEETAQHPGAFGGRDNFVGHGVINPMAALTAIVPSEEGIRAPQAVQLPSGMPPPQNKDWTPVIVAVAGTGGGLIALLITLFVVHTIRRGKPEYSTGTRKSP